MRCRTTRSGGCEGLHEHVVEGVLEEKRIIFLFRARVSRWRHMDGNIVRLGRCSPPVARSRSRSFPDSRKNSRPRDLSEREDEKGREKERDARTRQSVTVPHVDLPPRILLQEGAILRDSDLETTLSREVDRTHAWSPPIAQSYRSRNPLVAHRARPREDRHRRTAWTIVPTSRVVDQYDRTRLYRTGSPHRDSVSSWEWSRSRITPAAERTLSEDARRRWSATAEDHLPTAVGQRWPEPVTHARRALDP